MDFSTANNVLAYAAVGAALLGPLTAVLITLIWESVRRSREQRQTVLQTLLATQGRPADPSYSWAIRTAKLHFSRSAGVMEAHARYLDVVRLRPAQESRLQHDQEMGRRQGILISEMLKDLGYKGLTSEQIEGYTAQGLVDREAMIEHALQALPHIAISVKRSADAAEEMLSRLVPQKEDPKTN